MQIDTNNLINDVIIFSLSFIIIRLTIVNFLKKWNRKRLLYPIDWLKLSVFGYIFIGFLKSFSKLRNNTQEGDIYALKENDVIPSLIVIVVFLIGLIIAELIVTKNKKTDFSNLNNFEIKNLNKFFIVAIGISITQLILISYNIIGYGTHGEALTGTFSSLIQINTIASIFFLSVLSIFKFLYGYKGRLFNIVFYLLFFSELISGLLSGMKENVITPFIIIGIPFILSGRKLSKSFIVSLITLLILLFPFINNYRNLINNYPAIDKTSSIILTIEKTLSEDLSKSLELGTKSFEGRVSLYKYFNYAINNERKWDEYKNLNRYVYLPISWIAPRFLVPDKPKSNIGGKLTEMVYGYSTSSMTATTLGWAFFEGGVIYVFVLSVILGLVLSIVFKIFSVDSALGLLLFISLTILTLKIETDTYFLISNIFQTILVFSILSKIFLKKNKYAISVQEKEKR